jgi:Uma2 family endonuclease
MSTEEYFERALTRRHSQLVDGEVVADMPTEGHRVVVSRVLQALNEWARAAYGRGEATLGMNLVIDERNVFSPDIAYLRGDRILPDGIQHIDGTPDLAVEGPLTRNLALQRGAEDALVRAPRSSGTMAR